MKIIRDTEHGGVMLIPLLVDWGVKRCNVKGCTNKPNTIVTGLAEDVPIAGFCEECFQEANVPGGIKFELEWDDFDAWADDNEKTQ